MVNWAAVQAVSNAILVLTSAGAIGYAGMQLGNEREYRSVSNLEKQLSFFLSESFALSRKQLALDRVRDGELLDWDLEDPPLSAIEVLDFYEHVGLLVRKGHLNLYDVWHTFYEFAQPVYVDLRELIESEESVYSDHYSDLRTLMRQMDEIQLAKMHAKKANHWALWTPERILEHYRYEIETNGRRRRMRRSEGRGSKQTRAALDAQ